MCPWFQDRIVVNLSDFKSSFYYEITILSQAALMGTHMKVKDLWQKYLLNWLETRIPLLIIKDAVHYIKCSYSPWTEFLNVMWITMEANPWVYQRPTFNVHSTNLGTWAQGWREKKINKQVSYPSIPLFLFPDCRCKLAVSQTRCQLSIPQWADCLKMQPSKPFLQLLSSWILSQQWERWWTCFI